MPSRAARQPPYSAQEIARRGKTLYEQVIRPRVTSGDKGEGVVIDIETGAFEWERNDPVAASHRLLDKNPQAVLYARRVGYSAYTKMGGSWRQVEE